MGVPYEYDDMGFYERSRKIKVDQTY